MPKCYRFVRLVRLVKNHHTIAFLVCLQHALFLPVLICHLRFHKSLEVLETTIDYKFRNRSLLQLALTHPSYR